MIFHILTNIEPGKSYQLQKYIDNRNGDKKIGLKNIIYYAGWFNIGEGEFISPNGSVRSVFPGTYTIEDIIEKFKQSGLTLIFEKSTGIASIIPRSYGKFTITNGIMSILGFETNKKHFIFEGDIFTKIHGEKPVKIEFPKELRVCLEQLNTESNYMNGEPSKILNILHVYREESSYVGSTHFDNPSFKNLQNGNITELTVCLKDENNDVITNKNYKITVELCIK